jgi:hypothetical protein
MNARQNRSSLPPALPGSPLLPADGFISDATLTVWLRTGVATRQGNAVSMRSGVDLILTDALRVLGRRDGESDPYGLTGRVMSLRSLIDHGATVHTNGIRIGTSTYDVELGFMFQPLRSAA